MAKLILLATLLAPVAAFAQMSPTQAARFHALHVTLNDSTIEQPNLCSAADPSALAAVGIAFALVMRRRR